MKERNNRLPLTPPLKGPKPYVEPALASMNLDEAQKSGYAIAPASQGEKDAEAEWVGRIV